jgi:hypothetical protein
MGSIFGAPFLPASAAPRHVRAARKPWYVVMVEEHMVMMPNVTAIKGTVRHIRDRNCCEEIWRRERQLTPYLGTDELAHDVGRPDGTLVTAFNRSEIVGMV